MSPELLAGKQYTSKSDIWSIGVLIYELLYGKLPWPARDRNSYLKNIKTTPIKFPVDKIVSEDMKWFIEKCLEINEDKRIGWNALLSNSILLKKSEEKKHVK
jgi:calcium-dependent protein kinase